MKDAQNVKQNIKQNDDAVETTHLQGQIDNLYSELNRIKQLLIKQTEQPVKQDKQKIKQRGLNIGKWNIVASGGYYRAFRNINGKNRGVYIGKKFTPEIARKKITAKGFDIGDDASDDLFDLAGKIEPG